MYDKFKISIGKSYLDEQLPMYKEMYPWLKEVNSQSLQQANKNLDDAYQRFFSGLAEYPTKKKKRFDNSFKVPQHYKINLTTSKFYLPKIGWIKVKFHRDIFSPEFMEKNITKTIVNDEVVIDKDLNSDFFRTATISRTLTRKYHISILTKVGLTRLRVKIKCKQPHQNCYDLDS